MKELKFAFICKILIIILICITPFNYACKSQKNTQIREAMQSEIKETSIMIDQKTEQLKYIIVETEKMRAEISEMKKHIQSKKDL